MDRPRPIPCPEGVTVVRWTHYRNSPGWFEDENGCHIWIGQRSTFGYAYVSIPGEGRRAKGQGRKRVNRYVYRVRYEREIGPIPEGMVLDHYVCNNGAGACCNPHHCRPVSIRENVLRSDSPASLAAAKTHCDNGHPLNGDNLVPHLLRRGIRRCKICCYAKIKARELADPDRYRAMRREMGTRKRAKQKATK